MATKSADIIVSAVTEFDGRALQKGSKQISAFDKGIKKLAKQFAALYSVSKIAAFAKASVAAFLADDKAARSLGQTLKNTGQAFAAPYVEEYIRQLEKTTHVLDDQLRPAFQQLLTVTGSIKTSQAALSLALNVSAGTGKDLSSVVAALSKGYSGSTTALSKLNAGLSKSILKSGDMKKITAELARLFQGQAAIAANTFKGEMDALNVSANNAKETIGSGIVNALKVMAGDTGIASVTSEMDRLAQSISDVILGIGVMSKNMNDKTPQWVKDMLNLSLADIALSTLAKTGKSTRLANPNKSNFQYSLGAGAASEQLAAKDRKDQAAKLKESNKLRGVENAAILAKLKATADAETLQKLKDKFDTERIGIQLALANATDEGTKAVLKGQLDILNGNADAAKKDIANLEAIQVQRMKDALNEKAKTDAAAEALGRLAANAEKSALGIASFTNVQDARDAYWANWVTAHGLGSTATTAQPLGIGGGVIQNPTITNQPIIVKIGEQTVAELVAQGVQQASRNGVPLSGSAGGFVATV